MAASIPLETWKVILQAFATLVGAVGLGWTINRAILGPRLTLSLLNSKGYLTPFGESPDAPRSFFYHLRVRNKRRWIANNVRVKMTQLTTLSGGRVRFEQGTPTCLVWAMHPLPKLHLLDVLGRDEEACNVGYIIQGRDFQLDAIDPARVGTNYKWPTGFDGFLHAREIMRLEFVAIAENARSNTLSLEITWDGQWDDRPEEMEKHLVVRTLPQGVLARVRSRLGLWIPRE